MVGSYAVMAGKAYIKGDVIKIKKWYERTKTCDVKNIDKIIVQEKANFLRKEDEYGFV